MYPSLSARTAIANPLQAAREALPEQAKRPNTIYRKRPSPMHLTTGDLSPLPIQMSSLSAPNPDDAGPPSQPIIVDIAAPETWPKRWSLSKRKASRQRARPSTASEMSLGILDYYFTTPSPKLSPTLPAETPKLELPPIDPFKEKFDFELAPAETRPPAASTPPQEPWERQRDLDAVSGAASVPDEILNPSAVRHASRPDSRAKETYTLFPNVKVTTPPRRPGHLLNTTRRSSPPPLTSHSANHPNTSSASSRPRKESTSTSIPTHHTTRDLLPTIYPHPARIPLRILSSPAVASTPRAVSTATKTNSTTSSPQDSRWSQDTVTSPLAAPTLGSARRTSFGSLLGSSGGLYPECFFDDDDDDDDGYESAPLRRKLRWQRRDRGSVTEMKMRRGVRGGDRRGKGRGSFALRVVDVVLCGLCWVGRWG